MSGIYIPDMEIPTKCPCRLIGSGYDVYCYAVYGIPARAKEYDECCENETRASWCPLVAVPDHGRLVNEGDLYDGIDKKTTAFRADVDNQKISQATEFGYWGAIHDVRAVLTNAPTIIPADKEADE